jgi:hypothetical protein
MRVMDLASKINERMGYPATTPLKIFEEIKPNMIEGMKMKATFLQSEIQDGDIVCFQVEYSEPLCVSFPDPPSLPSLLMAFFPPDLPTPTSNKHSPIRSNSTTSSSTASLSTSVLGTKIRSVSSRSSPLPSARRIHTTRFVLSSLLFLGHPVRAHRPPSPSSDGRESRRTTQARPFQASFHAIERRQRQSQIHRPSPSEQHRRRTHLAGLHANELQPPLLRDPRRQHYRARDEEEPQHHMGWAVEQGGGTSTVPAAPSFL